LSKLLCINLNQLVQQLLGEIEKSMSSLEDPSPDPHEIPATVEEVLERVEGLQTLLAEYIARGVEKAQRIDPDRCNSEQLEDSIADLRDTEAALTRLENLLSASAQRFDIRGPIALDEANIVLMSSKSIAGEAPFSYPGWLSQMERTLSGIQALTLIPLAKDVEGAHLEAEELTERLEPLGIEVVSLLDIDDPDGHIANDAEAVFVAGGNTFRLLNGMYKSNLINALRDRVEEGMPYIGSSAGALVALPRVISANDWTTGEAPPLLEGLELLPFGLSAHYPTEEDPNEIERRISKIQSLHKQYDLPMIGLPEGGMIEVQNGQARLVGSDATLFKKGKEPVVIEEGSDLTFLLSEV
jgi:dipeptidase E